VNTILEFGGFFVFTFSLGATAYVYLDRLALSPKSALRVHVCALSSCCVSYVFSDYGLRTEPGLESFWWPVLTINTLVVLSSLIGIRFSIISEKFDIVRKIMEK